MSKVCSKCKIEKALDQFHKRSNRSSGIMSQCKECNNKRNLLKHSSNPEKQRFLAHNRTKKYRQTEKSKQAERNGRLRREYGITLVDYNNMLISQNFSCAICEIHQSQLKKILHVDHCHVSGKIRGLLCNSCNIILGILKEDIDLIKKVVNDKMANYLINFKAKLEAKTNVVELKQFNEERVG